MRKNWALGFLLLFGAFMFLGSAIPTWGDESSMSGSACPWDTAWNRPQDLSGLIGSMVLDQDQHELGRVVGVTYRADGDVTNFLIVSSCLPGMQGEVVAIPYTASAYSPAIGRVILGVSMEDFKKAPTFSSSSWEMNQTLIDWPERAYRYWEKTPYFG